MRLVANPGPSSSSTKLFIGFPCHRTSPRAIAASMAASALAFRGACAHCAAPSRYSRKSHGCVVTAYCAGPPAARSAADSAMPFGKCSLKYVSHTLRARFVKLTSKWVMYTTCTTAMSSTGCVARHVSPFDQYSVAHAPSCVAVRFVRAAKLTHSELPSGAHAPDAAVHPVPGVSEVTFSASPACAICATLPLSSRK